MIIILGVGYGKIEELNLEAYKALKESDKVFINRDNKEVIKWLEDNKINYKVLNQYFSDIKKNEIRREVILNKKEDENIVLTLLNSPFLLNKEIEDIKVICKENKVPFKIINGLNYLNKLFTLLDLDITKGINIVNYKERKILDKRNDNIIVNFNEDNILELKNYLNQFYNKETFVTFISPLKNEIIKKIKIDELECLEEIEEELIVYLKKDEDNKKDFNDLVNLVEILRGENGCPWDMEQDNQSIKNDTLEEVYELIEAINNKDTANIIEELGDVIFHVVFHASVGKKEGKFDISMVLEGIINKMIFRHPHVFGESDVKNSREVLVKWEELKKKEKSYSTLSEEMIKVANTLPALTRAHKIQKKAAKVGFDFSTVEEAAKKVIEELNEVMDVYKTENKEKIYNEVGDLIFSCVNVSRLLKVNEEEALNLTIQKFINRFSFIENEVLKIKKDLNEVTMEEMNKIWEKSKLKEKN